MAAHPAIPELDRKGLREFGLTTGAIVAALFGLFFPWLLERAIPLWPWLLAGLLGAWGLAAPLTLRPVYRGWMRLGLLLSKITTPIIMGAVFFVVITPVSLLMRLLGKNPLARKLNPEAATYRVASHQAPKQNLERPY